MQANKRKQSPTLGEMEKDASNAPNNAGGVKDHDSLVVYARPFKYKKNKDYGVMIYITKDFKEQLEPYIDKLCRIEIKLAS